MWKHPLYECGLQRRFRVRCYRGRKSPLRTQHLPVPPSKIPRIPLKINAHRPIPPTGEQVIDSFERDVDLAVGQSGTGEKVDDRDKVGMEFVCEVVVW